MGTCIGALKAAATRIGVSYDDYCAHLDADQRWCWVCRMWHPLSAFGKDAHRQAGYTALCRVARNRRAIEHYQPIPADQRAAKGPPARPPHPGDKAQARRRINTLVRYNKLPHPNTLPCVRCGHQAHEGCTLRHEYDHATGYGIEGHLNVQVLCQACHLIVTGERILCNG